MTSEEALSLASGLLSWWHGNPATPSGHTFGNLGANAIRIYAETGPRELSEDCGEDTLTQIAQDGRKVESCSEPESAKEQRLRFQEPWISGRTGEANIYNPTAETSVKTL